ncbi:mini-circle protein [Brachybacterium endophyticum]|uniref:Mini-circle protein n=1 Tax=Brachybacterium endophyticum TaxID=2182385 RepID=A0A2U2RJU6_9MICO|nr:DinB family protein [Brachybacterium endophyticum]PWH06054.1 mini-circle protein [Brachybacterium endophyticum]
MTPELDEHGRPEPLIDADEWQTLSGFLDYQRATFAWKCSGLDAEQLGRRLPSSSMSLGGMMKHLAYVEDDWFSRDLHDEPLREPWASVDWRTRPDWEWETGRTDDPADVRALWDECVARARTLAARTYDAEGLGARARRREGGSPGPSLRWIMTHMIEEYARHNGHADLLRESIDGETGE